MSWWDTKSTIEQFREWVRGVNDPSRKHVRNYILSKEYKSVLDVGAGLCEDYAGFNGVVNYSAVDFTDQFVTDGKNRGVNVIKSVCDSLPFQDEYIDVVYCRHLIEHLPYYETTLNEMIRVAKKEVIVTFFLPTEAKPDEIRVIDSLNHNIYDSRKLESFVLTNNKVKTIIKENFGIDEQILYIILK